MGLGSRPEAEERISARSAEIFLGEMPLGSPTFGGALRGGPVSGLAGGGWISKKEAWLGEVISSAGCLRSFPCGWFARL